MRPTTAITSLLAAAVCVSASSSPHPVLAFTSQQATSTKLELPSDSSIFTLVNSLFTAGKRSAACELDAVLIVSADKIDRDTLASLRHSSDHSLRKRALDAPSQLTFNDQLEPEAVTEISGQFGKACEVKQVLLTNMLSSNKVPDSTKEIHFININVSDLRKEESALWQVLESMDESHPRNLVIVAQKGDYLHQHTKRQYMEPLASNGNWTEPTGGVFARYQLFSTPLILTLVLVGGVLLPIVYFAVAQLAQVQTPDQMGVRKDPISGDKKTQ
ncbi:uncharacterized protein MEPE_00118 [Melanopsichium pennsylvanicum]|uniref:Protein BIG1 n=2 Tax=Melanopsichium pennsylvanicum TaxID=63383 RepID=A0AAJ4XHR3_9BASI|nr:conserved hypothetical protein [Melanopsichium pennsylvanicum 4]SNX81413.1 uncharacterized protein MEPE_00118 [Melanopsichium pennsylvanicum]